MLTYPHGIHHGVPDAIYHAKVEGLVSKSVLDFIEQSPAHYRAWLDGAKEEESDALAFGKDLHCAVLETDRFHAEYIVEPDFGDCRFKANKEARDAWRIQNQDKRLISAEDFEDCLGMARSIKAHLMAGAILAEGHAEVALRWQHSEIGLECKGKADWWNPGKRIAADLKTTLNAKKWSFTKSIEKYRYHVQDALYEDAFQVLGEPIKYFVFIACEKKPPYAVACYLLDEEDIQAGARAALENMETLARCMDTGRWPAYGDGVEIIKLPRRGF